MDANLSVVSDQPISDEQLMLDYAKGNTKAFELLYGRHKGGVYRYFQRQCSDREQAEELFQDVWARLVKARARYTVDAKFSTWLYTLAHNRLVDYYRKQGRVMQAFEKTEQEQVLEGEAGINWQPDNDLQRQRLANCLQRAVESLPDEQREVFLLKQEGGMTLQQIAEVTGHGTEACKSRYRYAIKKLKHWLQHDESCREEASI